MKKKRFMATLAVLLPLTLLATSSASAGPAWIPAADLPSYTYRNAARSLSGVQYSEGSGAAMYFRKGVGAWLHDADSGSWQTTCWLGTVSTSSASSCGLKDSATGSKKTWGKYVSLVAPHSTDHMAFTIWLANAVPSARLAGPETVPDDAANSVERNAVDDSHAIPEFGPIADLVAGAVNSTFTDLGSFNGYEAWSVQDDLGAVHLLATDGTYLFQASSTSRAFATIGLPLRIDTPTSSVQFALLPSPTLDVSGLTEAGFSQVSGQLYATGDTAEEYSAISVPNPTARGGSPVTVPLFIPPTE